MFKQCSDILECSISYMCNKTTYALSKPQPYCSIASLQDTSKHLKAHGDKALKYPLGAFFDLVTLTFALWP